MIGIDLGARKITIVDVDKEFFLHIEIPKRAERPLELKELQLKLHLLQDQGLLEGPKWVEAPVVAGARNLQATIAIAQTNGITHAALSDTHSVAVSSWKQRTVGKGNADKQAVRQWLMDEHPELAKHCGNNQDLFDATCIALYGRSAAEAMAASGLSPL